MARPSSYSANKGKAICQLIAEGYSLRKICEREGMPAKPTVLRWLRDFESFRAQYAQAREYQAEHWADEILDIADDGTNDWMQREGKDAAPGWALNGEHVQRSRLRVDSRKWLMSKLAPKKYGDKIQHTGDGGGPVQHAVSVYMPDNSRGDR